MHELQKGGKKERTQTSTHLNISHLFQPSTPGAQEDHAVSIVDVGSDRGEPVPAVSVHRLTRHQLGAPQGLVYIQAAEVIVDGNRLHGERRARRDGGEDAV